MYAGKLDEKGMCVWWPALRERQNKPLKKAPEIFPGFIFMKLEP
jgi:hypothetical protein